MALSVVLVGLLTIYMCNCAVVVTKDDFSVNCGGETTDEGFGPINITIEVTSDLWSANNYTVYAFENQTCAFKPSRPQENPLQNNNDTFHTLYEFSWPQDRLSTIGKVGSCGMKRVSEQKLSIEIAVVEGILFTTNDKVFTVSCDYTPKSISESEVGEGGLIPTPPEIGGTATPNNLDRDYHLELVDYVTGRVLEGAVPIGTVVQLRIRAEGADDGKKSTSSIADDENGLQVSKCTASNSDFSNTVTLIDSYCSEFKDGIDFVEKPDYTDIKGFQSVDLLSWSPAFEMFAIAGGPVDHVVIFECAVTICRIDGECDGDNCPSKRKRRRVESAKLRNVNEQHRSKRAADSAGEVGLSATVIVDETEKSAANGTNFDMTALIIAVSVLGVLLLLLAVAAVAIAMRLTQSKNKARSRTSRTAHIYHHDNQYNDKVQHGYKETYY
ncbi:unnamed protein product [Owenia fusiformis]|uniref:Uncharacterized protein n=1 Tax=Owenia fusiformis TaxID=6347 RepID=A0A8J1XKB4_OWEFU|nr:unnamed protein product [Owenia fusiformis]